MRMRTTGFPWRFAALLVLPASARAHAQDTLSGAMRAAIDSAATTALRATGAPSASIAVVRDGRIAYTHAYGLARLEPQTPATPAMRYSVGSISKQFTASAILLLAERGKLSLDDKVSRWLPELTRANEVSLRHVLSMTSGYQDYWPQDYVMPGMLVPTTARQIVDTWARKPLDFEPGSRWQYSNTNYVIAGMIVEKASGVPLVDFLKKEVFAPLGMQSVFISDDSALPAGDPVGYLRYALGPPRPAPKEAKGWLFAAGELAMTARDLATWDISVIDQKVLRPSSYGTQQTMTLLRNGAGTEYGLGVGVAMTNGHRLIEHGGEVSGFTAANRIYPDDRLAVVVLANLDATAAPGQIADAVSRALFDATDRATRQAVAQARSIFEGLQKRQIDRSLFSSNANAYFGEQALADYASSLGPLGPPSEVTQTSQSLRGGMTFRAFRIRCGQKVVHVSMFVLGDGKLEQFQIAE
jgi:CubicO group peptidase (beta-lactamase class C family)